MAGATAVTVDEIVQSYGLTKVDLIKIDVDGYESRVLSKVSETIKKFKPCLVLELAPVCYTENPEGIRRTYSGDIKVFWQLPLVTNENTLSPLPSIPKPCGRSYRRAHPATCSSVFRPTFRRQRFNSRRPYALDLKGDSSIRHKNPPLKAAIASYGMLMMLRLVWRYPAPFLNRKMVN